MDKFAELLAKLDEDITSLTDEELTEGRTGIMELGRSLKDAETDDEAQLVEDAKALAAAVTAIDAELETRATAAAEAAAARDEAFAAFDTAEEPVEEPVEEPAAEPVEEPVVAAAPSLAEIAERRPAAPEPEVEEDPKPVIAAAVGSEDKMGSPFGTREDLAAAMWEAKKRGVAGGRTVARADMSTGFVAGAIPEDNWSSLQDAQRQWQEALQAGKDYQALTAAGFCAPAEPVYDFFQQGSRDGIALFPEVTARRGQLVYPEIVNIRDLQVQSGIGHEHTATMDEDGIEKPCYTYDCGTGATFDVKGFSTCLTYSNFDSQFWPERVTYTSGQALIAHDHEVNFALINDIVGDARTTTVGDGHTNGGTWVQFVNTLAQHTAYIKNHFRLSMATRFEALVPSYVLQALASDKVARDSTQTYEMAVAEVNAAAAALGVSVQWVYDWQELGDANWPSTYDLLLYPAGTVVKLNGGTLDLGVTRDSTLNVANDFQIFVETFDGHAIIGSGVFNITDVDLCPTGETGERAAIACAAGS